MMAWLGHEQTILFYEIVDISSVLYEFILIIDFGNAGIAKFIHVYVDVDNVCVLVVDLVVVVQPGVWLVLLDLRRIFADRSL